MKKPAIRLLSLALGGDAAACCEVARRYLLGSDGFPRHLGSAIEQLAHPAVAALPAAAQTIAECMRLEEILQTGWMHSLQRAADAGLALAQLKLGIWWLARHPAATTGIELLQAAAVQDADSSAAQAAKAALAARATAAPAGRVGAPLAALLQSLAEQQPQWLEAVAVAEAAARQALAASDLPAACAALDAALLLADSTGEPPGDALAALLVRAVELGESLVDADAAQAIAALPAAAIAPLLEARACAGDRVAAHALGRALCGIAVGSLPASALAASPNTRKGAALLLRAADAGCDAAWLQLHQLHADHALSVANPAMARFFLEKAADRGVAEAQRRLGALLLRGATRLAQWEQAIACLHQAAAQGDAPARQLLASLVLPVAGDEAAAEAAIAELSRQDPWLGGRLRIARDFGLTKREALCLDPVAGRRPWGLVVEKNPFMAKARLSAPRAIPALSERALRHLRSVAALFSAQGGDMARAEGKGDEWRRRSAQQRRLFAQLGLDETMFFAMASAPALDSFRVGSKWAFRARQELRLALAAQGPWT